MGAGWLRTPTLRSRRVSPASRSSRYVPPERVYPLVSVSYTCLPIHRSAARWINDRQIRGHSAPRAERPSGPLCARITTGARARTVRQGPTGAARPVPSTAQTLIHHPPTDAPTARERHEYRAHLRTPKLAGHGGQVGPGAADSIRQCESTAFTRGPAIAPTFSTTRLVSMTATEPSSGRHPAHAT